MARKISIQQSLRFISQIQAPSSFSICKSSNLHSSSSPILHESAQPRTLKHVHQLHTQFIVAGFYKNPFLAAKLLNQAAVFSVADIDYTLRIFRYVNSHDTVCVNSVFKAYSNSSVPNLAMSFYFEVLLSGSDGDGFCFLPNSFSFTFLLSACANFGCEKLGSKCHGQIVKNGVELVLQVENSLIHMYACVGLVEVARKVFDEMSVKNFVSWNSTMNAYVKMGDFDSAHKLFDEMPEKNVVSWNLLIGGYAKGGNPGCGLKLFRELMTTIGVRGSNATTMVNVVTACGQSARLKEGSSVHGLMVKNIAKSNLFLDTALLDMYCKCGKVNVARKVFNRMVERNLVCWNAMILGHAISGYPQDGINLFTEMVDHGRVNPDEITFIGVLCACARASLLSEGRYYFHQMMYMYDIKPNFAHYWCMANLLTGAGHVQEAEEAIKNVADIAQEMSEQALEMASLLARCRFQGESRVGERIGLGLIEFEPRNPSCYALLVTVYSIAGQWEDVARVRELMKERKVGRVVGCGLVDLKLAVHDFRVDDEHLSLARSTSDHDQT